MSTFEIRFNTKSCNEGGTTTYGLDALTEAGAVIVAGVGQGLVETNIFRRPLGDLMDLVAALLRRQFLPEVLQAEDDGRVIASHAVQRLLHLKPVSSEPQGDVT